MVDVQCMSTSTLSKSTVREQRRLRAMAMIDAGLSQTQVALKLGVSKTSVCVWHKAYVRGGEAALRAKPHPPRSRLKPSQLRQLERILLKGPRSSGYATELWTLQRVAEVIEQRFGIRYEQSNIWHILRRMGWSCQKPEKRARERDEDAIVRWRKQDWPRIKKRPTKRPKHRGAR
jgi:transposase